MSRRTRLSRTQLVLLGGVVVLLLALEILLVYAYVGIGRASAGYEKQGASATLMANVQRETLRLALLTGREESELDDLRTQRAILDNHLAVAEAAAATHSTRKAIGRIHGLLGRYDLEFARIERSGAGVALAEHTMGPLLDDLERETKQAFDGAELAFYQDAGQALKSQKRAQILLLGLGALFLLLAAPLAFSLHRVFDTQLKRLSAFPKLSPFPVVELAADEVRYANTAAKQLAADLGSDVGTLLPENWHALVQEQLATEYPEALDREVEIAGRTVSWSFFPVRAQGVVHGYGQDVTEGKRAELALKQQAELNEYQALHDSLTGLGNRRKLIEQAEVRLSEATDDTPLVLAIFDLDGFKSYNDTFGHPAGDALLARLGRRLEAGLPSGAAGFRVGGDEFCLLAAYERPEALVADATAALTESGEKFSITASAGFVIVPTEATGVVQALQLADQRLYIDKRSSRASAGFQARDALVQVLIENDPRFGDHMSNVAQLAAATAAELGLRGEDIVRVRLAADLHDIGKAAIPDTILDKPGPLDPEEWRFMRTHTLIGERILAAAPALAGIAPLVRSSHERVDGTGYPDGLAGAEIPLLARIVAIADAFDAMTADRSYRPALSVPAALAELERCAGTQFDSEVVAAFKGAALDHGRRAA